MEEAVPFRVIFRDSFKTYKIKVQKKRLEFSRSFIVLLDTAHKLQENTATIKLFYDVHV